MALTKEEALQIQFSEEVLWRDPDYQQNCQVYQVQRIQFVNPGSPDEQVLLTDTNGTTFFCCLENLEKFG